MEVRASPTDIFKLFYFIILKSTLSFIPYHFITLPTSLNSIFFSPLFKYFFFTISLFFLSHLNIMEVREGGKKIINKWELNFFFNIGGELL